MSGWFSSAAERMLAMICSTLVLIMFLAMNPMMARTYKPKVGNCHPGTPITITTGGTYSGCYQSNNNAVPAVTLNTTAPVTLNHAIIRSKGAGVFWGATGTNLTVVDSTFQQINPGAVVDHRAVNLYEPASFVFEHNTLINTDGVYISGNNTGGPDPMTVRYNYAENTGRYPHPTEFNCCVQFLQLNTVVNNNIEIAWNKMVNQPGESDVEDNINFFGSGGIDSANRSDVHHNLVDGAYDSNLSNTVFSGGGINIADTGSDHNYAHHNVIISTTNYGVSAHNTDNYADDNLLVNDGVGQVSDQGQAVVAFVNVVPAGLHTSGNRYNWKRFPEDTNQWPCYVTEHCSNGTQVSLTEQQARDEWEAGRVANNITIGPR